MAATGSDLAFVGRAVELWDDPGEAGYHPRLFGDQRFWERRNGDFTLTVRPAIETAADGRRRVGHPFGRIPRLLLSWLATKVVRTRSAEVVLGESLSGFMRALGMGAPTGSASGTITRLCGLGVVRNAMMKFFEQNKGEASVGEIPAAVSEDLGGDVPASSVHSYLNINTPRVFQRTARDKYRMRRGS